MSKVAAVSSLGALAVLAACHAPTPNDLVTLQLAGNPRYALSTEDGVLAIDGDDVQTAEVPIMQWYEGREVPDDATIVQRASDLVLMKAKTSRLNFSTFAGDPPQPDEHLFIGVIGSDFEHRGELIGVSLYEDGKYGDLLEVEDWFVGEESLVTRFAGAGVYANRAGVYQIVGVITGTLASNPNPSLFARIFGPGTLIPFAGLDAIAPVLPANSNFFQRGPRVFRPDFEYGVNRDGSENRTGNRTSDRLGDRDGEP